MKLECIVVCVNFSDVLAFTLPLNKVHFDRMVVVSDKSDTDTRDLCAHCHVELISTDSFYHSDAAFAKARGINAGLRRLAPTDWVVHMDADIVLPARTRELLEKIDLDPHSIYGCDRMMCPSFDEWIRYIQRPTLHHTAETFVIPEPFPLGARVARLWNDGWLPIGFFQLWSVSGSGVRDYPTEHGTAGRTDMLHALRWPRRRRHLIPELIAIHLEGPIEPGVKNWRGRRMEWFGPQPHPRPHRPPIHQEPEPDPEPDPQPPGYGR
jgi:hypothetical protein